MAMPNSSYVHSIETTGLAGTSFSYRDRVRQHCQLELIATETVYRHLDKVEVKSRLFSLNECRTRAWFVRNKLENTVRVASNSCRLRWCPLCAKARANYIRHEVQAWFKTAKYPKFLTVTVKHSNAELSTQINKIYDAFRQIRRHKWFKGKCDGGLWFFQICWNPERGEWHPHIHAIVTGLRMDYKKLRELWYYYTGDSSILDIRIVRDPKKVGDYVARYAARPCQLANLPPKRAIEAVKALYGRRLAGAWGTARCVSFRPRKIANPENWEYLGSWSTVNNMRDSDDRARAILRSYYMNEPLAAGNSLYEVEQFVDEAPLIEQLDVLIDPNPPPLLLW